MSALIRLINSLRETDKHDERSPTHDAQRRYYALVSRVRPPFPRTRHNTSTALQLSAPPDSFPEKGLRPLRSYERAPAVAHYISLFSLASGTPLAHQALNAPCYSALGPTKVPVVRRAPRSGTCPVSDMGYMGRGRT